MISQNEKGITLIVLIITIIIMIIIAGITITLGTEGIKESKDNKLITELGIINHALLQRKTKANLTGEVYPGTSYTNLSEIMTIVDDINSRNSEERVILKDTNAVNYYLVTKDNGLKELGINSAEDEYIVNYETGEVINKTTLVTTKGKPLYTYSVDNT